MQVVEMDIGALKPYEKNPRLNDQAVDAVARSLQEFGWQQPIVVDANKVIIIGHTRLKAAKQLGYQKVPCVVAEGLTSEQVRALRIADNKTGEIAEWDFKLLPEELQALCGAGYDATLTGFSLEDIGDILAGEDAPIDGATDPDAVPEPPKESESRPGCVYQLGVHRLLCGDSTQEAAIHRLIGDEVAALWLTDPPYNVAYEASNGQTIQNDSMEDTKFREFLTEAFKAAKAGMAPGATFYIFHADSEGFNFRAACHDAGFKVRQCLIWKKDSLVLGRQDYHWIHEPVLTGWKDGAAHKWYADRKQTTVMEFPKPKQNDVHPTMKPVEMLEYLLKNSSKRGDIVLDTFGGSGSTLMACERLNRKARLIELDEKYCDVIRRRWAEFRFGEGCDWVAKTPEVKEKDNETNL